MAPNIVKLICNGLVCGLGLAPGLGVGVAGRGVGVTGPGVGECNDPGGGVLAVHKAVSTMSLVTVNGNVAA